MQTILFTTTIANARNIAINRAAKDKVRVGIISHRSDIPLLVTDFKNRDIDLLVIPDQFIEGWSLRGYDAQIEFCEEFPKGDRRTIAENILRKKADIV